MQITPSVRAVQVPDGNPMHPQVTTIYLVGRGQVLTIDSGEDMDRYRWMLKGYLAATEQAEIGLSAVSHHHADHSANLRWLHDEFDAEVYVYEPGIDLLRDRLPERGVHALAAGDAIGPAGGVRLRVVPTPGHSLDSVCYYLEDEGVLFTGDTVLGSTTTTVSDLAAYMASLDTLRALPNLQVICPGHGPPMYEPAAWIDSYIAHRNERERQIVDMLSTGAQLTSWEIMEALYTQIDPRLRRAADRNVRSHLAKLAAEGRLQVHPGTPRLQSPEAAAQAAEEEHERIEVIRRADAYREEARRRELVRQENPPDGDWTEAPRYELL